MKQILLAIGLLFIFSSPSYAQQSYCQNLLQPDCEKASDHGCYWENYTCMYSTIDTDSGTGVENNDSNTPFSDNTSEFNRAIGLKDNLITNTLEATGFSYIINLLLPYILTGAGLILFAMLISGGFTIMTAVTDPKKAEAGKARITAAIIGFIIIFGAYWITQILEIILGVKILQ